ncbi:MAG: DNA polymerase III subunit gamma/tau [Candidatus Pelagibacter sp.]
MSINSKVLALKYRPQNLKQIIGQHVITETVYNSIKLNKVPNAYLFTGIRGVGKTTIARIIAKSLNCKNGIDNIANNNICDNCHCEAIANSNHMDVLEMDAASKTGVDDVRDLIEFSRYGPTSAKYKIFIIDEVHMLSKQAFNALLKTLEEPPEYLKFIFATTEIKKIPITVISRCQRFDLQRVKSDELFNFLKKITELEKGNVSDDVLKLIIKISEGSVRDALSLLDRGLINQTATNGLDLQTARKIYGYFDKGSLIELFEKIFQGDEESVLKKYKSIYEAGIDPKVFLNDFLEILYYFKNIETIKLGTNSFNLNDKEFEKIYDISKNIDSKTLLLYWQFAVSTLGELDIVSNQNIAIEMFLIRLLFLKNINVDENTKLNLNIRENDKKIENTISQNTNVSSTINQIKNVEQKEKSLPNENLGDKSTKLRIDTFSQLINICKEKKELKIKFELETNLNLISFSFGRMEISSNTTLERDFVKILSEKLFNWTGSRWLISFSSKEGKPTVKQINKDNKNDLINEESKKPDFIELKKILPDLELTNVETEDTND